MVGDCYRDAFDSLIIMAFESAVTARLVHGYPRLTHTCDEVPEGARYGHAWIELEVFVEGMPGVAEVCVNIDPKVSVAKVPFYLVGQIDERWVRRYTRDEAREKALEHGHYGPWHEGPPDTYLP